ncbi:MAG: TlpA family protein disulfide reductase [Oscillospiraceae bacterium]|nr:TlpA family protein disulfide reductase [Oscillospiraceae bacterium]
MKKRVFSIIHVIILVFAVMLFCASCDNMELTGGSPGAAGDNGDMANSPNKPPKPSATAPAASDTPGTATPAQPTPTPTPTAQPTPTPAAPAPAPSPTAQPAPTAPASAGISFPYQFTATDIYGNAVTEKTLGEKEVFFVHYWGSWCPPCIAEMPDLAALSSEYADRVGFLGLVDDYSSNLSGVINVVETYGIPDSFVMIDSRASNVSEILALVTSGYVPTTVLVSSAGVSDQLIGAYGSWYEAFIDDLLVN